VSAAERGDAVRPGTRHTVAGDLIRSLSLWRIWTRMGLQDVRRRFRRSVIGASWIFLNLGITIAAVGFIYGALLGQDLRTFLPFLTAGLVSWGYITASVVEGGQAFIASEGYVKQIGLPIYVYVLRFFVSITVTAMISSLAYLLVAGVFRIGWSWGTLWVVPGIVLLTTASLLLIAIFAYLTTRFRDAAYMAAAALQVWFYVTPVLWPHELLRARGLAWAVELNPLYHLLEVVRHPLLFSEPAPAHSYVIVLLLLTALAVTAWWLARLLHRRIVYFL